MTVLDKNGKPMNASTSNASTSNSSTSNSSTSNARILNAGILNAGTSNVSTSNVSTSKTNTPIQNNEPNVSLMYDFISIANKDKEELSKRIDYLENNKIKADDFFDSSAKVIKITLWVMISLPIVIIGLILLLMCYLKINVGPLKIFYIIIGLLGAGDIGAIVYILKQISSFDKRIKELENSKTN